MTEYLDVDAAVESTDSTVSVTAPAGSGGQALPAQSSIAIQLSTLPSGQPIQYKVGTADWIELAAGLSRRLAVDLSATVVLLRRAAPVAQAAAVALTVFTTDALRAVGGAAIPLDLLVNTANAYPIPKAAFPARASGIAPSGTLAANGVLTLGTALNRIYGEGLWLHLPAGAFATLPAGLYYCVMSSTTVGQVFTNGPGSALVVGSAAGYTGVTTAQVVASVVIPAGLMGVRGVLRVKALVLDAGTGNLKTISFTFGAFTATPIGLSFAAGRLAWCEIFNCNDAGQQAVVSNNYNAANAPVSVFETATVDTTAAVTLAINLQLATETDYTILQNAYVEFVPGL